ncbi:phosphotransferase [Dyella ginsengisoli]|uniref:Phosphotransferase n=1 Tax=Dyella ginsengisoli TaxID=363848 RepID=A0ABW8JPD8_9GAMM
MSYPTLEQYNEALQAPQVHLLDALLKSGSVRTTGLGLPLALCGGFALTYTVNAGGKRYALRCFHKEAPELERRYQAISARLKQLSSPYFLPFEFIPKGIRVLGKEYPIVKMEWASGETLSEFLEREHKNAAAITRLRGTLAKLAEFLERERIAHGDIQPGNVMVSQGGGLVQLIDYDGMFVEALRGSKATELGQLNFQHPKRSASDFDEKLDRFSFLALDVALQALASDAGIWGRTHSDPDAVVFRRNDYQAPGASSVFKEVLRLAPVESQAKSLAQVAAGSMAQVPSLSDFLQKRGIPQIIVSFTAPAQATPIAYQGPYPVLDALNYAAVLSMVGDKIELVGRILDVKRGFARNRTHYVFVNFADWRGNAVKLSIWSDGLSALRGDVPSESWVGRWITVSGLVDEPFHSNARGRHYTHLSITITQKGQIQTLTEAEAKYRLGSGPQQPANTPKNGDVLRSMGGQTRAAPSVAASQKHTPPPSSPKSGNQRVLEQMRRSSAPATQTRPTPAPSPAPSGPQTKPNSKGLGVGGWIFILLVIFIALRACSGH